MFVFVWLNYSSDCISGLDVRWLIVLVFKLILEFVLRVFFSNEFLNYFFFVVILSLVKFCNLNVFVK